MFIKPYFVFVLVFYHLLYHTHKHFINLQYTNAHGVAFDEKSKHSKSLFR